MARKKQEHACTHGLELVIGAAKARVYRDRNRRLRIKIDAPKWMSVRKKKACNPPTNKAN